MPFRQNPFVPCMQMEQTVRNSLVARRVWWPRASLHLPTERNVEYLLAGLSDDWLPFARVDRPIDGPGLIILPRTEWTGSEQQHPSVRDYTASPRDHTMVPDRTTCIVLQARSLMSEPTLELSLLILHLCLCPPASI